MDFGVYNLFNCHFPLFFHLAKPFYFLTEHRNMPLDDAMRLVGQNFDQYMQDLRERAKSSGAQDLDKAKTTAPQNVEKSDVTSLLSKAASGADLSADQLTKLIDDLSKRQQEKMGSSSTTAATNGKGGNCSSRFFSTLSTPRLNRCNIPRDIVLSAFVMCLFCEFESVRSSVMGFCLPFVIFVLEAQKPYSW